MLDTPPSVAAPESPITEMPLRATFEMRNVSFSYPGAEEPVLNDISFRVTAGETLAVVGSTGAGQDDAPRPRPAALRRHGGLGAA